MLQIIILRHINLNTTMISKLFIYITCYQIIIELPI